MANDSHAAHEADGESGERPADPPGRAGADSPEHEADPTTHRRDADTPGNEGGKHYEPL